MRVRRQEHCERVPQLLRAPDRLLVLREQQRRERVPQVIRARDGVESHRTARRRPAVGAPYLPRVLVPRPAVVVEQDQRRLGRAADRELVLADVLRERREQADGAMLPVLRRLARAVGVGRVLYEDRVLAESFPRERAQFARSQAGIGQDRHDQRVPLARLRGAGRRQCVAPSGAVSGR